jgi:hypothetical protein
VKIVIITVMLLKNAATNAVSGEMAEGIILDMERK